MNLKNFSQEYLDGSQSRLIKDFYLEFLGYKLLIEKETLVKTTPRTIVILNAQKTIISDDMILFKVKDHSEINYIRYFTGLSEDQKKPAKSLSYPIFSDPQIQAKSILTGCFKLSDNLQASALKFILSNEITRKTHFRTSLGRIITLASIPDKSGYVPQYDPIEGQNYSTLTGDWAIGIFENDQFVKPVAGRDKLMLGTSGIEYIDLNERSIFHFTPNQAAYAPGFKYGESNQSDLLLTNKLGEQLINTAWGYICAPNTSYYAQPDESVFYEPKTAPLAHSMGEGAGVRAASDSPDDFLYFKEMAVKRMPILPNDHYYFPLVPYAGIDPSQSSHFNQFELQILYPQRRLEISQIPAPPSQIPSSNSPNVTTKAATAHGLLATFDSANPNQWNNLSIAKDLIGNTLALENVDDPLKSALQTNQQFIVISDVNSVKKYFPTTSLNQLVIEDWRFDFHPDHWAEHGTIFIFKFYNKSLAELVEDPKMWICGKEFNGGYDYSALKVKNTLKNIIADAQSQTENPENYAYFLNQVVKNKDWNGILILNAEVPVAKLPAQVANLSAGIDPKLFYAHHFGIEVSPIRRNGTDLVMDPSSLFGLITYRGNLIQIDKKTDYAFQVLLVEVLFKNSQVCNFNSTICLTINSLFKEPVQLKNQIENNIYLKGAFERHDGKSAYVFGTDEDYEFELTSKIIKGIKILKTQLMTTLKPTPHLALNLGRNEMANYHRLYALQNLKGNGDPDDILVASRFSFEGNISFHELEKFDVFSYGDTSKNLSFSNMGINMAFYQNLVGQITFQFDGSDMDFDVLNSQARVTGFTNCFPVKMTGLLDSDFLSNKPKELGYSLVSNPLGNPTLSDAWYGLVMELKLGSLGALANKMGLTCSLLIAWSPNTISDTAQAFVGLKLPGAGGNEKFFSIQNILKLSIQSLKFVVNKTADKTAYLLVLKNISLKFFGISLPPSSSTHLYIFGNPKGQAGTSNLGWYAAYQKTGKKK